MNLPTRTSSRPVTTAPTTRRPPAPASFGQPSQPTNRGSTPLTARRIVRRPFATSRFGYDHSWVGAFVLAAVLLVAGLTPARAADPLDGWTELTAVVASNNDGTGVALIEVYEIE